MRALRIIAALIIILSVIAMSGCDPKVWSVDFTTVSNLDDWYDYGPYILNDDGVVGLWLANDSWIVAPVTFKGNFDFKLVFTLLGSAAGDAYFEVGFSGEEEEYHDTRSGSI